MLVALIVCLAFVGTHGFSWDEKTPLDEYVDFDDGYFSWTELGSYRYEEMRATVYLLNMTSQKWMDESYSSKSVWWHMMGVAIPDEIADYERAWIFTEGGSNRESTTPPDEDDLFNLLSADIAANTGIIGGYVLQNPNSPIVFTSDPIQRSRSEDRLIAYTWKHYFDHEEDDLRVLARMPMTKAGVRGMDAMAELAKEKNPSTNINKFMVTGASKRGWNALSIAAVDRRVELVIPIVFTLLNMKTSMIQHQQALDGGWTWAFEPYYDENITQFLLDPKAEDVFSVEDMYEYRERLTMPKLFILATGDEFFFPQDLYNWWDDMPEPKYLMYNENTNHILFPHYGEVFDNLQAALLHVVNDEPFPEVTWTREYTETGGVINLHTNPTPMSLNATYATTWPLNTRRDFRLFDGYPEQAPHPVLWFWDDVEVLGDGDYRYELENVDGLWRGAFIKTLWEGQGGFNLILTSEVHITPNTFPRPACQSAAECYGYLT